MHRTLLLVILFATAGSAPPVYQRLQPEFVCWESDMEFPVDCSDED